MADENGIIKTQRDTTTSGPVASADDVQLIDNEHLATDTEVSNSPNNGNRSEISPLQMENTDDLKAKKKAQEGLKIIIISSITFALSITLALILTIVFGPPAVPPHGAVACDSQLCSDMALAILKQGGSAVDAAVTATLCLGVVHPHRSGIGGGHHMIIRWHGKNTSTTINAQGKAPGSATEDVYTAEDELRLGVLSVTVPGSLKGLELAHSQYAKLSWKDVVTPVANLARDGFPVTPSLAQAVRTDIDPNSPLDDALVQMFYQDGKPVKEGDIIKLPGLAGVLDSLASDGVDAFYKGKYAEEIVNATSGVITAEDLINYDAAELKTVKKFFANKTIETVPAPGGGPLMLFILSVLENYTLSESNQSDPLFYHRLVETIKFMEGERYRFGDPAYVNTVVNDTKLILSQEYAGTIRNLISDDKVQDSSYYTQHEELKPETGSAHVSIIDPEETMVSITSTINSNFGSHVVTSSGIILNNEMYDFDLPSAAGGSDVYTSNKIEAGKRPQSSMTPTVVHQFGKPCAARMVLGGVNGTRIISGVAEVLLNGLIFGQNISSSVEAKRICNPLVPNEVEYDSGFSEEILKYLKDLGHKNFKEYTHGINFVHVIAKINETVMAHGDMRESASGESIY